RLTRESPSFPPLRRAAEIDRAVKQNRPAFAGQKSTPRSERVQTIESRPPEGVGRAILWFNGSRGSQRADRARLPTPAAPAVATVWQTPSRPRLLRQPVAGGGRGRRGTILSAPS